ncbi:MAG: cyclic pyranopterin monophosphate synthase MoaC, partial [Planctomycetota bacterium]
MDELTHLDDQGRARMVDVKGKRITDRKAVASGVISIRPEIIEKITRREMPKGDLFAAARIAGIMAAKQTFALIPLCHPITLTSVSIDFKTETDKIHITASAFASDRTGVEMEALTAVSVAALTLYDMCKAADRGMVIGPIRLEEKSGGKSGDYI